jgi:LysM repeat protein
MKKYFRKSVFVVILVVLLLAVSVSVVSASGGNYHRVRYGETLFSIGRYYGVSAYRIAEANNLYNPNRIYAGQVLYIPRGYDGGYRPAPCTNHHRVRYGETLYSIARRYGVSPWAIARANGIYNINLIYAGQVLYIPSGGSCGCYQQPCSGYQPPPGAVPPIHYPPVAVPPIYDPPVPTPY